jgi:hypothetical protein
MDYRPIELNTTENYQELATTPMMRVRFLVPGSYQPVNWPVEKPYWCTGSNSEGNYVVAYVESLDELMCNWPDAFEIDVMEEGLTTFQYSSRMSKPEFMEQGALEKARRDFAGYPVYGKTGVFPYTLDGYQGACRAIKRFPGEVADELSLKQKLRIHRANGIAWGLPEDTKQEMQNTPVDPALAGTQRLYTQMYEAMYAVVECHYGWGHERESQRFIGDLLTSVGGVLQGDGVTTGYFVAERSEPSLDLSLHLNSYFNEINN